MTPLLLLELRRHRPMLQRMILLTLAVCGVFFILGKRTPADQLAAILGSSLGVVMIVPLGIARDKMEGTLEFICGLPVKAVDIAASRLIAVAAFAVPWALGVGALSLAAPAIGSLNPVDVFVLTWLALFLLGSCATALFSRYDFETLLGTPIVALLILVALAPRAVRFWLPALTRESLVRLLSQPFAPLMFVGVLAFTVCVASVLAFGVTARGFATYRHNPARQ